MDAVQRLDGGGGYTQYCAIFVMSYLFLFIGKSVKNQ